MKNWIGAWLCVLAAVTPVTVAAQQAESRYWRLFSASADSAFLDMCTALNGIALVMKREQTGELKAAGATVEEGVALSAGIVAISLQGRYERFEVITPPQGLERHHEQIGRLFQGMHETLASLATRALWATCKADREIGRSCDRLQRQVTFGRDLLTSLSTLMGSHLSYQGARGRLEEELTGRGVRVPAFSNPKCLTVEM